MKLEKIKRMPDWIMPRLNASKSNRGPQIEEGQRNSTLVSLAGFLRAKGSSEADILNTLIAANKTLCSVPLEEKELENIAKSIASYPSEFDSGTYTPIIAPESKWIAVTDLAKETSEKISWIWEGYIAKGSVTMLSAQPKAGKSTLLGYFLKAMFDETVDSFLGQEIKPVKKVLILTEEPKSVFVNRLRGMGALNERILVLQRYKINNWDEALQQIVRAKKEEEIRLVVIDTLTEFWDVRDENDSQNVMRALKPLKKIAHEFNLAILLVHHLRKAPGEQGTGHRGSSALAGATDINLELREDGKRITTRLLNGKGRFEQTPHSLTIELDKSNGVYKSLGSPEQFSRDEVEKRVLEIIDRLKEPLTRERIMNLLNPKPGDTLLKQILKTSLLLQRTGKGTKGSPMRYSRRAHKFSSKKALRIISK